ncbi:MAG TPA: response regulator transcription factor [Phycisphaerae bacterium]|nr:response regulator transcription factor [Phycisphaerae bacterium]
MASEKILIVDDERDLVDLIRFNLERSQYQVLTAQDGETALAVARRERPDLIVLDIMLPRASGRDVTMALKNDASTKSIPIIMLTALTGEGDVVLGLQLGADDYVTKPFSMDVLLARVGAVLRRRKPVADEEKVLQAGPLSINRSRHTVELDGSEIPTTLTEFRLLEALVTARARVLSRDQLMSKAMGPDVAVTDRTIDVHVTSLRRKLGRHRELVETVRGVGYRFADVWQQAAVGC